MQVNILGAPYTLAYRTKAEDIYLEDRDGYCDTSVKCCVARDYTPEERKEAGALRDLDAYRRKVMRHEITHAFLQESGLDINTGESEAWATNEEMVDWLAIQGPKIFAAWQQAGCL